MIIDSHIHIFPDEVAKKAIPTLAARSGKIPATNGTADDTKRILKESGIDRAIVLNIATKPKQTPVINDWIISFADDDVFIPFGTVHPDYDDKAGELLKLKNAGIKGIKIHPDYQAVFANDRKMWEIYELAEQLGLVVIFHSGLDIGLPDPIHCTPKMLVEVADNFPKLQIVAAHYGAFKLWDAVEELFPSKQSIYIDTAFSVGQMPILTRERLISKLGAERVLMASDCPWENPADSRESIERLKIGDDAKEKILGANAMRLLNI